VTSKREREYARRRYEAYQARVQQRHETAVRRRRMALIGAVGGVVVAALAVLGIVYLRDDPATVAADVQPTAAAGQPTANATAATSDPSATPAASACPQPGPEPRQDPLSFDQVPPPENGSYAVTLASTCGDIVLALDGSAAPQAVGNMVFLAREGFFNDTPCHRLTTEGIFVLQCGDPTASGQGGPGYSWGPIENAPAGDVYPAGTVAMARVGGDGESMGSQFFLVYADSTIPSDAAGGYTVMGTITQGLDIVETVAAGGLGADGIAPAESIGFSTVTVEEAS